MVKEIYSLYTIFWTTRKSFRSYTHYWVWCTAQPPQPWGYSECRPGEDRRALRENFGRNAVGILVDGKLWTDESVLWQNKLQDRAEYEVVYRKPWFFRLHQLYVDHKKGVIWDKDVPHAAIPHDEPPKVKLVHGPSREWRYQHLPPERGRYWGLGDRRNGKLLSEVRKRKDDPPPPYSER